MNKILLILSLLFSTLLFSQVGVNTTSPDPSSMLDVSATNKGALFPRVGLSNINLTTLDGTNIAATGLLIWNTNATTIGGNGVGYYYFNGTIWVPVLQTGTSDHDWYQISSTLSPTAITDNIYTLGRVTVGSSSFSQASFNVINTTNDQTIRAENNSSNAAMTSAGTFISTGAGVNARNGLETLVSGGGTGEKRGVFNFNFATNTGDQYGTYNYMQGTNGTFVYGTRNAILTTSPNLQYQTGTSNDLICFTNAQTKGTYNFISGAGTGDQWGTQNRLTGFTSGTKYGSHNFVDGGTGPKFGVYSEVPNLTNSFAGYFLGRMSIGTTAVNNYILPASRGVANQIMQTDGAGNISWVNPPTDTDDQTTDVFSLTGNTLNLSLQNDGVATQTVDLSSLQDEDWYEIGGVTPANSINDNIYTIGDVVIGKATPALAKLDVQSNAMLNTLSLTNTNTSVGLKNGIENTIDMNVNNNNSNAIINNITGLGTTKNGVVNLFNEANTTLRDTGLINNFASSASNSKGVWNFFSPPTIVNGIIEGLVNQMSSVNITGGFRGVYNDINNNTNSTQFGLLNSFSGGGSGIRIGVSTSISNTTGDMYGSKIELNSTGAGTKYGEFIDIDNTSGGKHYGIYSDVTKTNSFAGYFLGRMSIGTTTANNYILPLSRGINNQIMQTDGSGNVSWTDVPSDADWFEVGGTTPANSISDNIYTGGDVSIGKNTAASAKLDIDANIKLNTLSLENTNATAGSKSGIVNIIAANNNNTFSYGLNNNISGLGSFKYGVNNFFATNNLASIIYEIGVNNTFLSAGNVGLVGCDNFFTPSLPNSAPIIGYRNELSNNNITGSFVGHSNYASNTTNNDQTGLQNNFFGNGNGNRYGVKNDMSGPMTGDIYGIKTDITTTGTGNKYGESITIDTTTPGIHFGIASNVLKANSFAGYFLGRVSIGTTIANNYVFPSSRGTANQIMITDGVGTISWVNPSTIDDQTIDVLSLTGNTLNLSLQDDGVATQTLDLSPVANTHWTDAGTYLQPTTGATKDVLIGATSIAPTAKLTLNSNSGPLVPQVEIIENQANDDAKIKFSNAVELTNNWSLLARSDDTAALNLFNINHTIGGNIVRINGEGRVGIMRTAATNAFEVGGDASKTTAGAWLANSDSRLKKNISTISPTDALNKVLSLRGVNYEWNDDKTGMKRPQGNQIGFVAQEIQEVFPEKVSEDKLGYLQTAYGDYDPIIFQAIKALSEKIDKLEKENEELKKLIKGKQ